jgi:hypothetical protein
MLLGTVFISNCSKNQNISNQRLGSNDPSSTPTAMGNSSADAQLRWIALGYSVVLNNSAHRSKFEAYLGPKAYNEDIHDNTNPFFIGSYSIDYENEVYSSVNTSFSINNYDRDYYYDFSVGSCLYKVGIRHDEPANTNKPYRVTYQAIDTLVTGDSAYGYYVTPAGIDSTLLTEDNYDDYNLFIVFAQTDCGGRGYGQDQGGPPIPACNGNGICEEEQGEDIFNCPDCQIAKSGGEHELFILEVTLKEDRHPYEESWITGKYEIDLNWIIASGNTGISSRLRTGQHIEDLPLFNTWKRKEMRRCKPDGSKCKNGMVTKSKGGGKNMLFDRFNPMIHDLYFQVYEVDPRPKSSNPVIPSFNGNPIIFSNTSGFNDEFLAPNRGGTFNKHQNAQVSGEGVIFIPSASNWTLETIGPDTYKIRWADAPSYNGLETRVKVGFKI